MTELKVMKPGAILKKYFGLLPGQSIKDFTAELKALDPAEKRELAEMAAAEIGVAVES